MLDHRPPITTSSFWQAPPSFQVICTAMRAPNGYADAPVLAAAVPTWRVRRLAADGSATAGQPALFEACCEPEDWRDAYWQLLLDRCADLMAQLAELEAEHGAISLACWERDPAQCHRRTLAQFLRAHGVTVGAIR